MIERSLRRQFFFREMLSWLLRFGKMSRKFERSSELFQYWFTNVENEFFSSICAKICFKYDLGISLMFLNFIKKHNEHANQAVHNFELKCFDRPVKIIDFAHVEKFSWCGNVLCWLGKFEQS